MQLFIGRIQSPLGDLLLVTDAAQTIHALGFADPHARVERSVRERYGDAMSLREAQAPPAIVESLTRYFAGELDAPDGLRTAATGSALQCEAWAALRRIAPGTTTTYGKLARSLGFDDPRAAIDIGVAMRANPVAIVVPCHRVIGGNGDLKGYAWGVYRKRWLLGHENALPSRLARVGREAHAAS